MSHLDPYGGAEARGWDRPDQPTQLPWPDPDLAPGPWPGDLHAGGATDRGAPAGAGFGVPGHEDAPTAQIEAVRGGADLLDHDDAPTGQIERVRAGIGLDHEDAPTAQFAPVHAGDEPDPDEPSSGKRHRGRRRAGAGRPANQQPATSFGQQPAASPGQPAPSVGLPASPGQQPAPSRAGRNLPAAISVGVCLGAVVLLPLFLYTPSFLLVLAAAFGVGIWEMSRAVRRAGAVVPLIPLIVGGVLTVTIGWFGGLDALLLGLLVTVAGTLVWRLGDGTTNFRRDMTAATLIAVYVPFLGGFAALLASSPDDGPLRVLVTLVAVVLSDTGGYAAGANFGKHPMAPTISPKKSWEGFVGSVSAAALGSALLLWLLFDVAPWWGAVFGVAVSGAAVLGDLAESMIKRDLGVKDMSNLLPGHGGLMDRLDSVLFAVPTAYLLLVVLVPAVS
ncbi:phosphatidate cytidylyltransferase [Micromonospora sp. NPDC051196]|uniref:phosphatidate cytidylyltransferase n=1 Tax=Micromonospora sp. NPDC051196 TaxID=3155281 RepID=UPI0034457CD7